MKTDKKQIKQNQVVKDKIEQKKYLDSSRFKFDDIDFSTDLLSSYYEDYHSNSLRAVDLVPGNFSGGVPFDLERPKIQFSDSQLTNIHEELAETRKQVLEIKKNFGNGEKGSKTSIRLNSLEKQIKDLSAEMGEIRKYAPILKWAKNYIEHKFQN